MALDDNRNSIDLGICNAHMSWTPASPMLLQYSTDVEHVRSSCPLIPFGGFITRLGKFNREHGAKAWANPAVQRPNPESWSLVSDQRAPADMQQRLFPAAEGLQNVNAAALDTRQENADFGVCTTEDNMVPLGMDTLGKFQPDAPFLDDEQLEAKSFEDVDEDAVTAAAIGAIFPPEEEVKLKLNGQRKMKMSMKSAEKRAKKPIEGIDFNDVSSKELDELGGFDDRNGQPDPAQLSSQPSLKRDLSPAVGADRLLSGSQPRGPAKRGKKSRARSDATPKEKKKQILSGMQILLADREADRKKAPAEGRDGLVAKERNMIALDFEQQRMSDQLNARKKKKRKQIQL